MQFKLSPQLIVDLQKYISEKPSNETARLTIRLEVELAPQMAEFQAYVADLQKQAAQPVKEVTPVQQNEEQKA